MENKGFLIGASVVILLILVFGLYVWGTGKECDLENEKLVNYASPMILTHDQLFTVWSACMAKHGLDYWAH